MYTQIRNKKALVKKIESMDIDLMIKYFEKNFQKLGTGTSRVVFALNENWIIKIAFNQMGLDQNINEMNYYESASTTVRRLIPIINLEYSNCIFIISERLTVVRGNKKEIKDFLKPFNTAIWSIPIGVKFEQKTRFIAEKIKSKLMREFFWHEFNNNMANFKDLHSKNLGITNKGKVKIIDTGLDCHMHKVYVRKYQRKLTMNDHELFARF